MANTPQATGSGKPGGLFTAMLEPLKQHAGFRSLWFSSIFFFNAYWGQVVIFGWLAYDITGSEFAVALFGTIGFAPFLLGPIGGLIADRVDRARFLQGTQILALVVGLVVALLILTDRIAYWHILVAGFITGVTQAPTQPARFTLIMDFIGRQGISSANALNMAAFMGSRVAGPALGGLLIERYGPDTALIVNAVWYVPAVIFLLPVRDIARSSTATGGRIVADIIDGLKVFAGHRELRVILLATIFANLFAWPLIQAFLPVFAEDVLVVGPSGLGWLVAINGIGSLTGAMTIAMLGDFHGKGWMFLLGTGLFGLTLTAFSLTEAMSVALVLMFAAGLFSAGFGVLQSTLALLLPPEHARARVTGALMLSIGAMPLGMLIQGLIAPSVGVVTITFVCGLLLAGSMTWLGAVNPGFRKL